MAYIKHLDISRLLFNLWSAARYTIWCIDDPRKPVLTMEICQRDIATMIASGRPLDLDIYYGKPLYVDLSDEVLDTTRYNRYNGKNSAEKIVAQMQKTEMHLSVLSTWKA